MIQKKRGIISFNAFVHTQTRLCLIQKKGRFRREEKKRIGILFLYQRSPHVLPSKTKRHTAIHSDIDCFLCCCSLSLLLPEWVSVSKLLLLLGHLVLPCFSLCLRFLSLLLLSKKDEIM